jgi:hypothetical protein
MSRYVKNALQAGISIGVPLGNLKRIRLPGIFQRKRKYIWVPLLGSEDITI